MVLVLVLVLVTDVAVYAGILRQRPRWSIIHWPRLVAVLKVHEQHSDGIEGGCKGYDLA